MQRDLMPIGRQRLGDHRAADAHADDQDLRLDVAGQRVGRNLRRTVGLPDRAAGSKIEFSRMKPPRVRANEASGIRVPVCRSDPA